MVQITGKYQNDGNENFFEYLKSLGPEVTDELAKKYTEARDTIDITIDGNNVNITSTSGRNQAFTFGQAFDDQLFAGTTVKSTAVLNGNKVEVTSVSADNRTGSRVYEFTDSGLVVHYSTSKASGKRLYKRV